jgi:hypothetical protein
MNFLRGKADTGPEFDLCVASDTPARRGHGENERERFRYSFS